MAQQLPPQMQPQPKLKAKKPQMAVVEIPKTDNPSVDYAFMKQYQDKGYVETREERGFYVMEAPIEVAKAWEKEAQDRHYEMARSKIKPKSQEKEKMGDTEGTITQEFVQDFASRSDFLNSLDSE